VCSPAIVSDWNCEVLEVKAITYVRERLERPEMGRCLAAAGGVVLVSLAVGRDDYLLNLLSINLLLAERA
jgi:hypothetical protein